MVEKFTTGKKIAFAIGQFGWSLAAFSVANLLPYFYIPPVQNGKPLFPTYIFQGAIFGVLTIIGLINAFGRVFDAITDPLIANFSDRKTFKLGKRSTLLLFSSLPFAAFSVLVFVPLVPHESIWNAIWLTVAILIFYLSLTFYCTPYNALIHEYGQTPEGSLSISTYISITWALGFALGSQVYLFKDIVQNSLGLSPTAAFQTVLSIFATVAFLAMLSPVIFIKEKKYSIEHISNENVIQALKSTFSNVNFRRFIVSDFTYWLSLTFIQTGISYFVVVLLELPQGLTSQYLLTLFIVSFLFYIPVNLAANKFGKKNVVIFAFIVFAIDFLIISMLGKKWGINPETLGYLIAIIAAIPIAIFGILPNAIVADLIEANGRTTGQYNAGMFYAARTFMMKLGVSLANLIFPSFLLLGKEPGNDLGVRLAAVAAVVFCVIGLIFFLFYDEKYIFSIIKAPKKEQSA